MEFGGRTGQKVSKAIWPSWGLVSFCVIEIGIENLREKEGIQVYHEIVCH